MNEDFPLVSIITPSYNQARYIEDAIISVISQEYPKIEYIVIDGGSTDGSQEVIQKYSDRIHEWVSEKDTGQCEAINKGFQRAHGEIITWLNSDDVLLQGAIREAVQVLSDHPDLGMVYGDGLMVDTDLRLLDPHTYQTLDVVDLLSFEVILQPGTFFRKSVLEETGYLDESYHCILDHELWVRIASRYPILHVDRFWALERTHPEAKTIALTEQFVNEADQMIQRAQSSETLSSVVEENRSRIYAGLYVFQARRLIDAKQFGPAVRKMLAAMKLHPLTVARYWYKFVQAVFSALGFDAVFMFYRRLRRRIQYGGQIIDVPISKLSQTRD